MSTVFCLFASARQLEFVTRRATHKKKNAQAESNNKDTPMRVCAAEEVRLKKSMLALKSVKGGERMLSGDQRTTLALLASHANNVQVMYYYSMCPILPYVSTAVCVSSYQCMCPRGRR